MTASGCPSDDILLALLLGRLPEEKCREFESHFSTCAECGARTRSIQASDPLLDLLSSVKDVSWSADDEANARQMVERFSDRSQLLAGTVAMGGTILTLKADASGPGIEPSAPSEVATHSSISPSDATFLSGAGGGVSEFDPTQHIVILQPVAGATLGAYRLEKKLGEGGMGAVWKAFHTKLKKPVALKVLAARLLRDATLVARFEREMEAVGRLDHPAIVRAMDAGEVGGTHYLVMEYVEGVDFGELVKSKGARTVRDACEMVRQAAIGLAYAHRNGLIHRDIKPSNLFLTKDGKVKILDLGLARLQGEGLAADVGAGLTGTGQILGTPDYMAPEQWENTHTVGPACDLYALGCTLFHLLTGRAPFADEQHQSLPKKMMGHVGHVPPSLSEVRASLLAKVRKTKVAAASPDAASSPAHDIPPGLEAIYQRLLAKEPEGRFPTAEQLATALFDVIKARPTAAVTAPPTVETASSVPAPAPVSPPVLREKKAPAPKTAPSPEVAPSGPPSRSRMKWMATFGGFAAALLLGVIVITIKNRDGSVTKLEVDDPAEITIAQKKDDPPPSPVTPEPVPRPSAPAVMPAAAGSSVAEAEGTPVDYAAERKVAEEFIAFRNASKVSFDLRLRDEKTGHDVGLPYEVDGLPAGEFTLCRLNVYTDKLTDEALDVVGKCRHLESLSLPTNSQLTDAGLKSLRSLKMLTTLDLSGCTGLGGEVPALVAANPDLQSLHLGDTAASSDVLPAICGCRQLEVLRIDADVMPAGSYAQLAENCRDLRELNVYEAHGVDIPALASLPFLKSLAITGEHLTPERFEKNVAALKSMPSLESLTLNPPASDDCLTRLAPLAKTLRHLSVVSHFEWDPGVTAQGWKALDEFTSLETLEIGGHKSEIDGPGLIRLASLPSLRKLSVGFIEQRQRFAAADVAEFRKRRPDIGLRIAIGKEWKEYSALEHYPRGADGRSMAEWDLPDGAPPPAVAPFSPEEAKAHQEAWAKFKGQEIEIENSLGMKFRLIPTGQSTTRLVSHGGGETRPFLYRITQPYHLGATEVTVGQFRRFLNETGYKPTGTQPGGQTVRATADGLGAEVGNEFWDGLQYDLRDDDPATLVSHIDASEFCNWLSKKEGAVYRLPTECEWFFAASAGGDKYFGYVDTAEDLRAHEWDRTSISFPLSKTSSPLHSVASLKPNPFGLYDVMGNVLELARDRLSPDLSTFSPVDPTGQVSPFASYCGGSWRWDVAASPHFGAGSRGWDDVPVTTGYFHIGFRALKELPGSSPLPKPFETPVLVPPGAPLSVQAVVSRPEPVAGLRSWSIELASHQGSASKAVAWSPQGDVIATAFDNGGIRLWNREGKLLRVLLGHAGVISDLSFSHDGKLLASGDRLASVTSNRSSIRVWDVDSGLTRTVINATGWIWCVAFAPDRYELAFNGFDGGLAIVNLTTNRSRILSGPVVQRLSWSGDGRSLVTGNQTGQTVIWHLDGVRAAEVLKVDDPVPSGLSSSFVWSHDNKVIAEWRWDKKVRLWDSSTGLKIRDIPTSHSEVGTLSWGQDHRRILLAGGVNPAWSLVDSADGRTLAEADKEAPSYYAGRSPDESEIVGWNHHGPLVLTFFDAVTGKVVRRGRQTGQSARTWLESTSPDGRTISLTEGDRLRSFDAETGQLIRSTTGTGRFGETVVWSPDGRTQAIPVDDSDKSGLALLDVVTGERRRTLQIPNAPAEGRHFNRVCWSPDSRQVATSSDDGIVRLWNVDDGQLTRELTGHAGRVCNVSWSPDGTRVASAGVDKSVRVWDSANGNALITLTEFPEEFTRGYSGRWSSHNVAWTPDSRSLWIGQVWHAARFDIAKRQFDALQPFSNGGHLNSLSLSPDGTRLLGQDEYGWTLLRDLSRSENRILGRCLGHHPVWLPDSRRFVGDELYGAMIHAYDTRKERRLGTLYPYVGGDGPFDQWVCIGPTGHYRGSEGIDEHIVYVAMHEDGQQLTYSPAEFREKFRWMNDPEKAAFLQISADASESNQ